MMKEQVDVAILVANYNNAKFISDFLSSIRNSTVSPKQVIIIDDGSTDNSVDIIKEYIREEDNVHLYVLNKNEGFANALNEGLKYVKSKYVLRVDPDDILENNRIKSQYEYLEQNKSVDILGGNICYFDSDTNKQLFVSNVPLLTNDIIKEFMSGACGMIHGSLLLRYSVLKKYNYVQNNVPAEDYDILSRMILDGAKVENLPKINTFVRVHLNSVSNNLPYATIKKTFELCESLWGRRYSKLYILTKYIHLRYYRRFLFDKSVFKKIYFITIASIMNPSKVIKRLKRR